MDLEKFFDTVCQSKLIAVSYTHLDVYKRQALVVAQWTKIPVKKLTEGESKRLAKLENQLHKRDVYKRQSWTYAGR